MSDGAPVLGCTIEECHHAWQDLDPKSLDKPRDVLDEDANEERIEVLGCKSLQVLVHDLTSLELVVKEVDDTARLVPA